MTLTIELDITDAEYRELQNIVEAEGKKEAPEEYASRVGLKGLRGTLEARVIEQRQRAKSILEKAYDTAPPEVQAAMLAQVGYEVAPDGGLRKKE